MMYSSISFVVILVALSSHLFEVEGWTKIQSLTKATNYKVDSKSGTTCNLVFKDCGSVQGSLLKASLINGTCSQSGTAVLKKGTTAYIDFQFKASADEPKLTSKVAGKIGPLPWVNFPLDNPDACKDSGLTCPVPANKNVEYVPHINVLEAYPSVNVIVRWELQDKDGKDVYCALIPATIQ